MEWVNGTDIGGNAACLTAALRSECVATRRRWECLVTLAPSRGRAMRMDGECPPGMSPDADVHIEPLSGRNLHLSRALTSDRVVTGGIFAGECVYVS